MMPPQWFMSTHALYPLRFKATVRQLLLAAARAQQLAAAGMGAGNQAPQLALLPDLAFARVLQLAVEPLAAWY
jgi:hypothetical protein